MSRASGSRAGADAFRIDAAVDADVPDLVRLVRALAVYEKLGHLVVADEAALRAALSGPTRSCEALIARSAESGEAVGFALFFHNFSTFLGRRGLYLEDLFVVPERRGSGLGRALLARLASIAHERGCGRFEWTVLDWNQSAIGFYEAMGASVLPDWRIVRMTGESITRLAASDRGAAGALVGPAPGPASAARDDASPGTSPGASCDRSPG